MLTALADAICCSGHGGLGWIDKYSDLSAQHRPDATEVVRSVAEDAAGGVDGVGDTFGVDETVLGHPSHALVQGQLGPAGARAGSSRRTGLLWSETALRPRTSGDSPL